MPCLAVGTHLEVLKRVCEVFAVNTERNRQTPSLKTRNYERITQVILLMKVLNDGVDFCIFCAGNLLLRFTPVFLDALLAVSNVLVYFD